MPTLHSGSNPSLTRQQAGHIACTKLPGLHEIFKYAYLIYGIWPQTYIHTTSGNAVMLVWGLLRLAPIKEAPDESYGLFRVRRRFRAKFVSSLQVNFGPRSFDTHTMSFRNTS